jgi:alkylation response protein AidB-like acyl-CoA dehydrogenase
MNFALTPEQQEVRALARDFAEREVAPVIRHFDEAHEFPHEILVKLAGTGLLGALVPEEYGGAALDYVSYALAVEELNRVDASVGITMWAHNSLCTNHIALFGSREQKAAYLPRLARGESLGAWGLTEPGSGSDAAAMRTRAVAEGDHFVIDGAKAFITNAGVAEIAVVMAVTDPALGNRGISAFVLERGMTGFSAGKPYRKLGLHASNTAELHLDHVRVPASALLGTRDMGFVNTMQVLEGGRIAMAAMAVGLAQGALDEALKYMKQRSAFGKTLAEFNGLQGMIADIGTEVEAARLLTLRAAALKDAGVRTTRESSMAKLYASEVAVRAAEECVQIHGGYGFVKDYPAEKYFRDVKLLTIGEGTSEVQRLVIARQLLA